MKCVEDCFHCPYSDCIRRGQTKTSRIISAEIDRDVKRSRSSRSAGLRPGNAYYWAHRSEILERARRYYQEHREERIAYQLSQYHADPDFYRGRANARYWANRDKLLAYQRGRYQANKERLQAYQREYARRRKAAMKPVEDSPLNANPPSFIFQAPEP